MKNTIPFLEQPDNEIITQGNEASYFYFIAEGDCKVYILNQYDEEIETDEMLTKGNYFGEISLIHECPTSASVKTINYCTFAKIPK